MKLLFVLLGLNEESKGGGMYLSLAQEYSSHGHEVTIMAPDNNHRKTYFRTEYGMRVLRVGSWATQGVSNMIKKGIALALLPSFYKKAYKRFLQKEHFDWVIMPTPPITLVSLVEKVKLSSGANFYLILRDIHPHSAASIGLIKNRLFFNYLENCARKGYQIADLIGCMSQGNIDFISSRYPGTKQKLVILYNWLKALDNGSDSSMSIREKFGLKNKFIALFGGNIGRGQRIENIVALADHFQSKNDIVFVVIGKGVEKKRLEQIAQQKGLKNLIFLDFMPQQDYLNFVKSVDLGLITINEKYTVPTCPSKAISYMSMGIPILAMINPNNDYGEMIEKWGVGYAVVGQEKTKTFELFNKLYNDSELRKRMSSSGMNTYKELLTSEKAYTTMIQQLEEYKEWEKRN